jgi:hypothetical protein
LRRGLRALLKDDLHPLHSAVRPRVPKQVVEVNVGFRRELGRSRKVLAREPAPELAAGLVNRFIRGNRPKILKEPAHRSKRNARGCLLAVPDPSPIAHDKGCIGSPVGRLSYPRGLKRWPRFLDDIARPRLMCALRGRR